MNLDEIREIVAIITEKDIAEFELERGGERIRIRRAAVSDNASHLNSHHVPYIIVSPAASSGEAPGPLAVTSGGQPAAASEEQKSKSEPSPPAPKRTDEEEGLVVVSAPIVGTFYEAPSPGSPPFVQVGDKVEPGQVLCIIEAMKLMNEIEAETGGVIVKQFVENAQPVEYGEALFAIKADR